MVSDLKVVCYVERVGAPMTRMPAESRDVVLEDPGYQGQHDAGDRGVSYLHKRAWQQLPIEQN